jgi:hypothetical protein
MKGKVCQFKYSSRIIITLLRARISMKVFFQRIHIQVVSEHNNNHFLACKTVLYYGKEGSMPLLTTADYSL